MKCTALGLIVAVSASGVSAASIGVNFGDGGAAGWNNVTTPTTDIGNLAYLEGGSSGISLTTLDGSFSPAANTAGAESVSGAASIFPSGVSPAGVTDSAFFGHTGPRSSTTTTYPLGVITLSNLDPQLTYQFTFFGARNGLSTNDSRETAYTAIGATTETVYLEAYNNTSSVAQTLFIAPDANNEIVLQVTAGPNNNNSDAGVTPPTRYYYINAMHIAESPVPEPTGALALGLGGMVLAARRRRC